MARLQRPGNTFCLGAIICAVGLHYDWNGWLIVALIVAIGWGLNDEESRIAEREAGLR